MKTKTLKASNVRTLDFYNVFQPMETEQIRVELTKLMELTAESLLKIGAAVRVLEERGEDIGDLRNGMYQYLRKVGYGQLLPEVIVRFQGNTKLFKRIVNLPIPDQKILCDADKVKLAVLGDVNPREVDLETISNREAEQLLGPTHIRSESEQVAWLRDKLPSLKSARRGETSVDVDNHKKLVIIREPCSLTRAQLVNLLARITD